MQTDTATRSGLTLSKFYDGFPNVSSPDNLLEPLRYITAEKEYEELAAKAQPQGWCRCFLVKHRQRRRAYPRADPEIPYGRVVYANRLFTSFKEGWKTDRGMIYIVFGTPNIVYKTDNTESWIYGEENHLLSMTFNFY